MELRANWELTGHGDCLKVGIGVEEGAEANSESSVFSPRVKEEAFTTKSNKWRKTFGQRRNKMRHLDLLFGAQENVLPCEGRCDYGQCSV